MIASKSKFPYLLIAPAILILIALSYLPMPYGIFLSLNESQIGTGDFTYVGLSNYISLFSSGDFWESFANTAKYAFGYTLLTIVLGLVFALVFNREVGGCGFYMTIIFIPWVVSEVVAGLTWRWLLNENFGILNYIFQPLSLKPSILLSEPKLAIIGLTLVSIWKNIAYAMILILAALQGIARELIEASKIDGCSSIKSFRYVTLPMLKQSLLVLALLSMVGAINQTGTTLVLTKGGPVRATETLSMFMYREAFLNYHLNNASSISVVLAIINILIAVAYFRISREKEAA